MPTTVNELGAVLGFSMADLALGEDFASVELDNEMLVVTNEQGLHGAVAMLDDEVLHTVAEVLVVKAEEGREKELAEMVADINQAEVPLGERLSDNVYFYDRLKRELTMATGSPEIYLVNAAQREDGKDVKPAMFHSGR